MHLRNPLIILIFSLLLVQSIKAQFGINASYILPSTSADWDEMVQGEEGLQSAGVGLAVDYWFRLKNYRIEFLPEVGAHWGSQSVNLFGQPTNADITANWLQYHLLINVNIYPFDFEGDCNCPTFGKDGTLFEKGFFVQAGAGASLLGTHWTIGSDEGDQTASVAGLFHLGAGLDIGVGEYLTLTPWFRYHFRLEQEWSDSAPLMITSPFTSTSSYPSIGIRVGYRWDYKRR